MSEHMINKDKDIDLFIHRFLIGDLTSIAEKWLDDESNRGCFTSSRIKEPDSIVLTGTEYRYAANITAVGDILSFDAALLCSIELRKVINEREVRSTVKQWLTLRCNVIIDGQFLTLVYNSGNPGSPKRSERSEFAVDSSLVPYIGKENLEAEAERFLEEFCPEALVTPMPVPIMEIIGNLMGLRIRMGGVLSSSQGIIGQVCFSDMMVQQMCFKSGQQFENAAPRGTVVVDIRTFKRSEGCVNNTLAHEALHWYRHRIYGTIRDILHGEQYIACRRTKKKHSKQETPKWTDEDRVEWQANNIAPRILMPAKPFRQKADELYEHHGYSRQANTAERRWVLESVISDLAAFFNVSKQSAKIRMIDLGYTEANTVYNYHEFSGRTNVAIGITHAEAFREYRENAEFRAVLDGGMFRYIEGCFVIDHENYIKTNGRGGYELTDYARQHLDECTLRFTTRREKDDTAVRPQSGVAFRMDGSMLIERTRYEDEASSSIIDNAEALRKLRDAFDTEFSNQQAITHTFAQTAKTLMARKKWNSVIFKEKTLLDDSMYSRIISNSERLPSLRTAVAICVGLGVDAITANRMLALAGHSFGQTKEHQAYCYLFSALHGKSIDECNAFLESVSVAPLGNRERKPAGMVAEPSNAYITKSS